MGTFKDELDAAAIAQGWCQTAIDRWAGKTSDPVAYYALMPPVVNAGEWMYSLNNNNPAKAKAVILQDIAELAATLAASEEKTRLEALAAETANLVETAAWYAANKNINGSVVRHLIGRLVNYLDGTDVIGARIIALSLLRTQNHLTGTKREVLQDALMTLWKTRCTEGEFVNGKT